MPRDRPREVRLHVSLGDPLGVGPELLARVLTTWSGPVPVIHGHAEVLERVATLGLPIPGRDLPAEVREPAGWPAGVSAFDQPGLAARLALEQAVQVAAGGNLDALVTAPVDKGRLAAAGFGYPGHTDFLATRAGVDVVMLFVAPHLRVAPATVHIPLSSVPKALTRARLIRVIEVLVRALVTDFGLASPRVALAALNPHAGEHGLLGRHELEVVLPALDEARQALHRNGLRAELSGPYPSDTVFLAAQQGRFDAVVAAYHDQAMIPVKLLALDQAVNLTVGLPYIRTSPAHGTAEDIAWQGRARAGSFSAAMSLAATLARRRSQSRV